MCLSVCLLYFYLFHSVCISFLYWSVCQSFVCVHPISVYLACLPTVSVYLSVDSQSVFLSVCWFSVCLSVCLCILSLPALFLKLLWYLLIVEPKKKILISSKKVFLFHILFFCLHVSVYSLSVSESASVHCVCLIFSASLSVKYLSICLSVRLSVYSQSVYPVFQSFLCLFTVSPSNCLSSINTCFTMTDEHDVWIKPLFPLIPARISVQTQNWMW